MFRKYHIHKLQKTLGIIRNCHITISRDQEDKQSKAKPTAFSSHRDDCKTRMDTNIRTTTHRTITESHNGSTNLQLINNNTITNFSDFIWPVLPAYMGVIPNPKMAFIFPISCILVLIFPIFMK